MSDKPNCIRKLRADALERLRSRCDSRDDKMIENRLGDSGGGLVVNRRCRRPDDKLFSDRPDLNNMGSFWLDTTEDFREWAAKGMQVKVAKGKRRYLRVRSGKTFWADGPGMRRLMFGDQ